MIDLRPILYAIGILVIFLGFGMLIPALVDVFMGNPDWLTFVSSAFVTLFVGAAFYLANKGTEQALNLKQAFLMTTALWVVLPFFAAFPLAFSELNLSFTDAYFEAMSGLTTTGSTVLTGLDSMPPGILLWRAILQWFGGIGIVVMAVAILPMLQVGGMQLFHMESSDTSDKILPRARQITSAIGGLYITFTAICALMLIIAGLTPFDAIAHAMTTIATGGFSTSDGSVGHFDSAFVDFIIILFMIVGSLPFVLYLQVLRGKPLAFWRDEQARTFLYIVAILVGIVTLWLIYFKGYGPFEALRYGSFNIISIMTGTGYATMDYGAWGTFSVTMFFCIMFIGGCAGSTSCGIKIFRFQVLFKNMKNWIGKSMHPNGIFIPRYNGAKISPDVTSSVMSFLAFFLICYMILAVLVALTGVDWVTAFSGAGTAIANVGPGLGDTIGPAGTFQTLPDSAKWILCAGMLLGRLELFTVLVLFSKTFWKS
ncbi:TrkH family potassium uptake protein [Temperatibacter marinus]|uniref:Trk system potassium uptake protein n=1 Tax=Temperatibacter marinus TaxID=1456591 RepID=A0AA52EJW8_9PROT|nr:TrkH family potassium uptake protein [Temperatibacter marinus]WND03614.1 TrkH family potassium uptake protein [Temperatibacter marinus]